MSKGSAFSFKTKKVDIVNVSTRFPVRIDRTGLWRGKPLKNLTTSLGRTGGRNNTGRITSKHMGGGHKRKYRIVDFKRDIDVSAEVIRLEYSPYCGCFLALIRYNADELADYEKNHNKKVYEYSYIIAPDGIKPGMTVVSGENVTPTVGNAMPLRNIAVGSVIHNVERTVGRGGSLARAAGTFAKLLGPGENKGKVIIAMPSGFKTEVSDDCRATIGSVSNPQHVHCVLGTAGASRHRGMRPVVRGRAMNHHDHAHGGKNKRSDKGMRVKRGQKTVRNKNHWS